MLSMKKLCLLSLGLIMAFSLTPTTAQAKNAEKPLAQVKTRDGLLRLSPNQSEVIRLNRNAASVIISNPAHATVVLDTPRLLVVIPQAPGATSFTALDANGEVIIKRDVLVSTRANEHVRVRRACSNDDAGCVSEEVYYCPNGCYAVNAPGVGGQAVTGGRSSVPDIAPNAPSGGIPPMMMMEESAP